MPKFQIILVKVAISVALLALKTLYLIAWHAEMILLIQITLYNIINM